MTKLLFLDFDGVLHRNFSPECEYFGRANFLIDALDNLETAPELIISSSWRFQYPFDEMLGYLPDPLCRLVAGATPEVEPGRYQRYREIRAYLNLFRGNPDWRALDDDIAGFPDQCDELIVCNGHVGIDSESAKQLRNWLRTA